MEDEFVNNVLFITLSRFFNNKKNTRYKNYKIYRENSLLRKKIYRMLILRFEEILGSTENWALEMMKVLKMSYR